MLKNVNTDQLLELAIQRQKAGDLVEARRIYSSILDQLPGLAVAMFRLGVLELQVGHAAAALPLMAAAVESEGTGPAEVKYQFGMGEVQRSLGRWHEAAAAYQRVLVLDPQRPDAHQAMGMALASIGDHAAAINSYLQALKCQPDLADVFNLLGNSYRLVGDAAKAESAYRRAIEIAPDHAGAMSNLGTLLHEKGETAAAMLMLQSAVELRPDLLDYQINLAGALCNQRYFSEAISHLKKVLELEPDNAQASHNMANALNGLGHLREAAAMFERAIAIKPDFADALNNLGTVCKALGEFQRAMAAFESAIRLKPDFVVAMNNAGCLLRTIGKIDDAEAMLRRGLAIDPQLAALWDNLGNVLKDAGQLEKAIDCFTKAVELDPSAWGTHSNLIYSLGFSSLDGKSILKECQRWNQRHTALLETQIRFSAIESTVGRRLRIGYVSPDFRDHCQALFTLPLLSNHNHEQFEIFCYSSVERPDAITRQIAGYADVWREVRALDDAALSDLTRADRIDILIDLTMHMSDGRPLLFARKAAPVQIAWLAYPGTTGMTAMDYRLSDPRLEAPDFKSHYSERTICLPDSFWCYDPLTREPAVNPLPALHRGYLTLGCLNNPCKLTDDTLRLWGAVMNRLSTAKLLLIAPPGKYRLLLLDRFSNFGVASDRVRFLSYRPRAEYLKSYHEIDLGLDTFPYNGHTTSLDSFWMGVPVVTRIGPTCVGRGGLSQLFQLGMTELATESDDEFVSIVVNLATDLPRLAALREGLRLRIESSPLMDGKRFARNIEAVYHRVIADRR